MVHAYPSRLAGGFFLIVDFSGFLVTVFAWRADLLRGRSIGGPTLSGQTRAARSAELFGWLILAIGFVTLLFPGFTASLLKITSGGFSPGANYLQLVGLLVGGLGMLFDRGWQPRHGRLRNHVCIGTIDRPAADCALMVARAFRGAWLSHLSESALRAHSRHYWPHALTFVPVTMVERVPFFAQCVSAFFAFLSGVVRNSRVFHPDGRVFLGRPMHQ